MWRPENWEEIAKWTDPVGKGCTDRRYFEAGADAILEAIWEMAEDSPTGTFTFDTNTINVFEEG